MVAIVRGMVGARGMQRWDGAGAWMACGAVDTVARLGDGQYVTEVTVVAFPSSLLGRSAGPGADALPSL